MSCYVIQVTTGRELDAKKLLLTSGEFEKSSLVFPRRKMYIRRQGTTTLKMEPIFKGYLFLILPEGEKVSPDQRWAVRKTPEVYKFLKQEQEVIPLSLGEEQQIFSFLRGSGIAGVSQVTFDENDRIQVLKGPLKGKEGQIVKVDRRKRRVKVRLSLYEEAFLIDFSFDFLGKDDEKSKKCKKD